MITENDIMNKFALVTADTRNNCQIGFNGEVSDCTSFMSWQWIWNGVHFSYDDMAKDSSPLLNFKIVMFSGNPGYFKELYNILDRLNNKVITIFLPEGDISFYDMKGINSFSRIIYDIWNKVNVIFSMEEDKIPYYNLFTKTPAVFVHVPLDAKMESGVFRYDVNDKKPNILVYGDNNPNCPVTVYGIAKRLEKQVITVCIDKFKSKELDELFGTETIANFPKIGQYIFLRLLGRSWIHFYPTRWIGSAREPIACAVAGTPCIGSDRSHTQKRLFPKLACDIYDAEKMIKLGEKLYQNLDFYKEVVDYAWEQVKFYNMENTIKRFMDAVNKGEENRIGKT